MTKQELVDSILKEIDELAKTGVSPVTSDMLQPSSAHSEVLECLVTLQKNGVISGNLVTEPGSGKARRLTSIRLTYSGLRALRDSKPPF